MPPRLRSRAARRLAAVAIDLLAGEPPAAAHPTVWMGHAIGRARAAHRRHRHEWSPATALAAGGAVLAGGALVAGAGGWLAERLLGRLPAPVNAIAGGALLKPALSLRALLAAGREVEKALERGDLERARRLLAWHLVSRDVTRLTAAEVAGAAIESLAENLSDAFIAPLFYDAIGGLGAAYAYRFVNTADAMLGYRTRELEWFGKAAARADDVLNLVPARVTAVLIALASVVVGGSARRAVSVALADARRTPSPNAGWPMAAMAGSLGVRLDKRQGDAREAAKPRIDRPLYVLHAAGRPATANDLRRARRLIGVAAAIGLVVAHLAARPGRGEA